MHISGPVRVCVYICVCKRNQRREGTQEAAEGKQRRERKQRREGTQEAGGDPRGGRGPKRREGIQEAGEEPRGGRGPVARRWAPNAFHENRGFLYVFLCAQESWFLVPWFFVHMKKMVSIGLP
jgi:hypothetical protein